MQVKPIVHRVKGFYRLADYALRWGMIAPDAQRRLEAMNQETRDRLQQLKEIAKNTVSDEKDLLQKRSHEAKDVVRP